MAVEKVEAFVLALLGDHRAEHYHDPTTVLEAGEVASVERMVEVIDSADLARLPEGAVYLRRRMIVRATH